MGGSWSAVVWAGFIASVLAACVFWLFRSFEWTRYSPTRNLGCLFFDDPRLPAAETTGVLLFLVLGSTVGAALYAALMGALGGAGWGRGLLLGLLHGAAVAGLLPWTTKPSRCVRMGRLPPPGYWGLDWGRATPVLVMAGFGAYGALLGAVLDGF